MYLWQNSCIWCINLGSMDIKGWYLSGLLHWEVTLWFFSMGLGHHLFQTLILWWVSSVLWSSHYLNLVLLEDSVDLFDYPPISQQWKSSWIITVEISFVVWAGSEFLNPRCQKVLHSPKIVQYWCLYITLRKYLTSFQFSCSLCSMDRTWVCYSQPHLSLLQKSFSILLAFQKGFSILMVLPLPLVPMDRTSC